MKHEDNPKSIKYYVKRFLLNNQGRFQGKRIVDFPAGNGVTSRLLKEIGAEPRAYDLFPEYFDVENMECKRANIKAGIPLEDNSADGFICQEGIEHFSDQFEALKEFNRVLKEKGILLVTTPNYSSIRARLSYLLTESERSGSKMPPNELDSIWMSQQKITSEIYFGHLFLTGIQKLRVLAKLAGFKVKKVYVTHIKPSSLVFFSLFYPFILFSNWLAFQKNIKKNRDYDRAAKKAVYGEMLNLAISPKILLSRNLMVEFVKEQDHQEVSRNLKSRHKAFGIT